MISQNLALAAQRLAQDVVTGEVVEAMRRRGVRPLLIKGPVLERWLYQDGTKRRHGDIDLVVASDQFADAEAALAELGFAMPLDLSAHIDLAGERARARVDASGVLDRPAPRDSGASTATRAPYGGF